MYSTVTKGLEKKDVSDASASSCTSRWIKFWRWTGMFWRWTGMFWRWEPPQGQVTVS